MRSEPDVIGYDAELLGEILDDHPDLTVKRLAFLTGRNKSTIYRYLDGQKTLPTDVLRAAFEYTADFRLLRLIAGRVPILFSVTGDDCEVAVVAGSPAHRISSITELLPRTCESVERAAVSVKHMAAIVADARIDQSDAAEISRFRRDANSAVERLTWLLAALSAHERPAGFSRQRKGSEGGMRVSVTGAQQ